MRKIKEFVLSLLLVSFELLSLTTCVQAALSPKQLIPQSPVLMSELLLGFKPSEHQYQQTLSIFRKLGIRYIDGVELSDDIILINDSAYSQNIRTAIYQKTQELIEDEKRAALQLLTQQELSIIKGKALIDDLRSRKDLQLKHINENKGYGVFATHEIKQGDVIGCYAGVACHNSQVQDPTYAFNSLYACKIKDSKGKILPTLLEVQIDAKNAGNITRFINAPNSQEQANCIALNVLDEYKNPHIVFVTSKFVKPRQELTIDYGSDYRWNNNRE